MRTRTRRSVVASALLALGAGVLAPTSVAAAAPAGAGSNAASHRAPVRACAPAGANRATCFAEIVRRSVLTSPSGTAGKQPAKDPIVGLRPADIASAYRLTGGSSGVVAIVDAYDNPNAEADLAVYRAQWHLPACTTANGCFRKVNQRGAPAPLPDPDPGWGIEMALDLEAVSAACPQCSILLVEGDSASLASLGVAVNTAVTLGAKVVSNSYGTDEFNGMKRFGGKYYTHAGVPIVVSSGDYGFTTAQFPAVLTSTIAVGGTTLTPASNAVAARPTSPSRRGSTTPTASCAPSPTSRRWPIRTPAWRSTTPTRRRTTPRPGGSRSAARACRRRWCRRC
jgi:hypothetical protein